MEINPTFQVLITFVQYNNWYELDTSWEPHYITTYSSRMLVLAHEKHLGMSKTKALLRENIYFPGMDMKMKALLKEYLPFVATSTPDLPPPLTPSELPPMVYTLNIDFDGPYPNQKYLLVVIDHFSR